MASLNGSRQFALTILSHGCPTQDNLLLHATFHKGAQRCGPSIFAGDDGPNVKY